MKKLTPNTKLILIIILIVVTWYFWPESKPKGPQPTVNPTPKYFVTISGNIDPKMKKPIYMGFWASYAGYNDKCQVVANKFEGVVAMPGKTDFYPAITDKQGNYTVKIPIDKYVKEPCDWKIVYIDYSDGRNIISPNKNKAPGYSTLMQFGNRITENANPGYPYDHPNATAYHCSDDLDWCSGYGLIASYNDSTPRDRNYDFTQNYKE